MHLQKVCAGPARAAPRVPMTRFAVNVRRHAAEGRLEALGWGPPGEQKAGGAPKFKSLRSLHAASLPLEELRAADWGRRVNRCMPVILLVEVILETSYLGRTVNLPSAHRGRTDSRRNEEGY